jgi:hypothetical protein
VTSSEELLAAHDAGLRGKAELADAADVSRIGPVWLGRYGERGFVSYTDLAGADGEALDRLIADVVGVFEADPRVSRFEWKTRGHDLPSDLEEHLSLAGLRPEDPETVMIGEAALLAGAARPPAGVTIRQAGEGGRVRDDVLAVGRLHREVFGPGSPNLDEHLLALLSETPQRDQIWLAEADGTVVCAGRLTQVPDTRFVGLFGGATASGWRHRGVYRALTAARAGAAMALGADLVYAECTEFSRPILERAGLVKVTTTTPWLWHRPR